MDTEFILVMSRSETGAVSAVEVPMGFCSLPTERTPRGEARGNGKGCTKSASSNGNDSNVVVMVIIVTIVTRIKR